jgi:hypothetical protein
MVDNILKRFSKSIATQRVLNINGIYKMELIPKPYYNQEQTGILIRTIRKSGYDYDIHTQKIIRRNLTSYAKGLKLRSYNLLIDIIKKMKLKGKFKIQIFREDNTLLLDLNEDLTEDLDNWWDINKKKYELGNYDDYVMIWHATPKNVNQKYKNGERTFKELGKVTFKISPISPLEYNKSNQSFLDGGNTHCVLHPIILWAEDKLQTAASIQTKKRYTAILNIIYGKDLKSGVHIEGLLEKYKHGVGENEFQYIADLFQINLEVEMPFQEKMYIDVKSKKKSLKTFKLLNTRSKPCRMEQI